MTSFLPALITQRMNRSCRAGSGDWGLRSSRAPLAVCAVAGFSLTACSALMSGYAEPGRSCSTGAAITQAVPGQTFELRGTPEIMPDGWIGVRLSEPLCLRLAHPEGNVFGPKQFDVLHLAVPNDPQFDPVLPVGLPIALTGAFELNADVRTTPIILRVIETRELETAPWETGKE